MSSVLITGGLSDFTNALAVKLVEQEESQKVVILHNYNIQYNKVFTKLQNNPRVTILNVDSCNEEAVLTILGNYEITKVFDTSLTSSVALLEPLQAAPKLLLGITNVLDALRKYGKIQSFTLVSGEQVYGISALRDETQPLEPVTFEGSGQMSVEAMVHSYAVSYRIPTVIGRIPTILYSTADELSKRIEIYRDDSYINILSLNDAANGILTISNNVFTPISEPADVFNVSNDVDFHVGELKSKNSLVETRPSTFTNKKLANKFGFKTSENFMDEYLSGNSAPEYTVIKPKILIFGKTTEKQQFVKLLRDKSIEYKESDANLETTGDSQVHNEILHYLPSHIIYFSSNKDDFDGDCFILRTNMSINLYLPWLLASEAEKTGIHFTYVGINDISGNLTSTDESSSPPTSALAVKEHTDKMLRYFKKTQHLRILPDVSTDEFSQVETDESSRILELLTFG